MTEITAPQVPFVFVIPVRNPDDKQVQNYETIELLLKNTISSLCNQRYGSVQIIVVCHRIPEYASQLSDNVTFLDISDSSVFSTGRNPVRVDKGLKYIIGILYAEQHFKPDFIMPLDADDFVHRDLVEHVVSLRPSSDNNIDGYMLQKGVHALLEVEQGKAIRLNQAFHIRDFNLTCGSCRVFIFSRLISRLITDYPALHTHFTYWPERDENKSVIIPGDSIKALDSTTCYQYNHESSLVNALGRHMTQQLNFVFTLLDYAGAAKGCGHGNHDGPLQGSVHEKRIIGVYPIRKFLVDFGLTEVVKISSNRETLMSILRLPKYYLVHRPIYLINLIRNRCTSYLEY